jgi:hypothetical protein
MSIWKYIDINPDAVEEVRQQYLKILPQPAHFFLPVDIGLTKFNDWPVFRWVLIQAPPLQAGVIHIDHRPHDNNKLAINIPLINCDDASTEFFETTDTNTLVEYTRAGTPYINYNVANCKKVDEFILTKPVVFRTDIPHRVVNRSNQFRLGISIRLVEDPWHLL